MEDTDHVSIEPVAALNRGPEEAEGLKAEDYIELISREAGLRRRMGEIEKERGGDV